MPHVYIKEIDSTIPGTNPENTNVVYIPGVVEKGSSLELNTPTPFSRVSAFKEAITGDKKGTIPVENVNAIMALNLLRLGFPVLFESFGTRGDDTDWAEIASMVDWSKLIDRGLYRVKYLTVGAASSLSLASDMIACAARRGDCIALIDHDKDIEVASGETVAETIFESFAELVENDGAKYGAAFSPWCKCSLEEGIFELPGSFVFLGALANSIKGQNPSWFAAAGSVRGKAPFDIEPLYKFGDADCAILQGRHFTEEGDFDEDDNYQTWAINPISNIDPFGNIVWGNRTLMFNENGLSASSFLNIRNLVCDLKKVLYNASRKFTFEQNSDILWFNFSSEITPLLDRALSGSGIRGYKLTQEQTEVKGRLKARVRIIPIEAVEDFDLTVELTDSLTTVVENA